MRNIITISVVLLLLLPSCNQQPSYRIGVSQCLDDAWRQKMNEEMERELLLHPDMTLYKRIAYGNNELQCAQIDSFVSERVDLLIVSPNEAEEVKPAVTRAYKAGIPVIVADRRVTGEDWTAFIGGDNYRVGELMGEWINGVRNQRDEAGGHVKGERGKKSALQVVEVAGLTGSTPARLRHEGMKDKLQALCGTDMPEVHTVLGEWQKEDAYEAVCAYLSEHADVDVIVAQNDLMAIGASEAVRDSKGYGAGSIRIMGVDGILPGLQAIVDGVIECTATYLSRGDMVIETAAKILSGAPYVRDTVLQTTMVDATAARALLMQHSERLHDLQTLHTLQVRSDNLWKQMRADKAVLITIIVLVCLLLFAAVGVLVYLFTRLSTEIRQDILPHLEEVEQTLETIQLSQRDVAFAERLKQIVDEYVDSPDLNVEFLGTKLQLSRTQIFRRVKTVTGKGPLEYIRERRLIRVDELLRTTDMTIQQVATQLCFSSPGYFTKCYKAHFEHLPSERE